MEYVGVGVNVFAVLILLYQNNTIKDMIKGQTKNLKELCSVRHGALDQRLNRIEQEHNTCHHKEI